MPNAYITQSSHTTCTNSSATPYAVAPSHRRTVAPSPHYHPKAPDHRSSPSSTLALFAALLPSASCSPYLLLPAAPPVASEIIWPMLNGSSVSLSNCTGPSRGCLKVSKERPDALHPSGRRLTSASAAPLNPSLGALPSTSNRLVLLIRSNVSPASSPSSSCATFGR